MAAGNLKSNLTNQTQGVHTEKKFLWVSEETFHFCLPMPEHIKRIFSIEEDDIVVDEVNSDDAMEIVSKVTQEGYAGIILVATRGEIVKPFIDATGDDIPLLWPELVPSNGELPDMVVNLPCGVAELNFKGFKKPVLDQHGCINYEMFD